MRHGTSDDDAGVGLEETLPPPEADQVPLVARGTMATAVASAVPAPARVWVRGPATAEPDYAEPAVVAYEHYTQRTELSRGGMGRIERARDRRLHRDVAIKELRSDTPDLRARFERETLLTARLQHPGIVSIYEAGRWPSGEPFYAMKLVRGRSLDELIARTGTQAERLALLPHLIAVADALGYAHAQRVIHRDLKPHNVMIGEFGETVVIDWGIAKDLDAHEAEPGESAPGELDETAYGTVLGTPGFMPPEQARGEPVDERADVYAIGAMIYQVLAGEPLYTGSSAHEVLEAVIRGPERSLDEALHGLPPDLVAIVRRAMAREPAGRYRDAGALAEDLRRFQTGQLVGAHQYSARQRLGRWLRRNRTAAVVGAIALIVLTVGGIASLHKIVEERSHAEDERALAEQHRAEVEDLLGFLVEDLHDKLKPIGKLELLDAVTRKAERYYESHPPERDEDRRKRSIMLRHVGDVRAARGDSAGSLAAYRTALADAEQLAGPRYELAEVNRKIALALRDQGKLEEAITTLQVARAMIDPKSTDLRGRAVLASVELTSGDTLDFARRSKEARPRLQAALDLANELIARSPDSIDMLRIVLTVNLKLGESQLLQGDAAGALAAYRKSRDASAKILKLDPDNAVSVRDQGIVDEKLGDLAYDQGDSSAALTLYRRSLAASERLATRDPSNRELRHQLFIAKTKVGNALHAQKDYGGALAIKREALTLAGALREADPKNTTLLRETSVVEGSVAETLLASGHAAEALTAYQASNTTMDRLVAQDPKNLQWQRDRMIGRITVGSTLAALKDHAGAVREYREAVRLAEALASQMRSLDGNRDLMIARLMLARTLEAAGDIAGALESTERYLPIARELADANRTNVDAQRTLTSALYSISQLHARRRSADKAIETAREAVAVAQRLAARDPANGEWQHDVVTSHQQLGDALKSRDRAAAKAAYQAALVIVERFLAAKDKTNAWDRDRAVLRKALR